MITLDDIKQAIESIAKARQHAGKSTDMLDSEAREDLARNLAQGFTLMESGCSCAGNAMGWRTCSVHGNY